MPSKPLAGVVSNWLKSVYYRVKLFVVTILSSK